ncbi:T9SS type A sorting domain-containing protein [Puia sp. P3]|uniref:T9SS type A sorting domain-containing protein n=1 Tax=Puia sp. P3 TaxID=3423952 RepID=UPI003D67586C
MKQLYSLTTSAIILALSATTANAQVTYTAVRSGNWSGTGPNSVWATVAPSPVCNNCQVVINDGVTVHMDASLLLNGPSVLQIGTAGSSQTTQLIFDQTVTDPNNPTPQTAHNNINMYYGDGVKLILGSANASIDATNTGEQDGLFLAVSQPDATPPYAYLPRLGTAAVPSYGAGATMLTGAVELNSNGTLPIILFDFSASLDNGSVNLDWTTVLESNSDHFDVERSNDAGAHWSTIGTVAAHGNSSQPLNYSFTDSKVVAGTAEYRLQLVDRDGKYAYSQVKAVRNGLITSVSVYPNPAHDYVNVTVASSAIGGQGAVIRLMNQSGQLLLERSVTSGAGSTVALSVSSYPQGNYLIVVVGADGSKQVSKLLISK